MRKCIHPVSQQQPVGSGPLSFLPPAVFVNSPSSPPDSTGKGLLSVHSLFVMLVKYVEKKCFLEFPTLKIGGVPYFHTSKLTTSPSPPSWGGA